jgi:hypothetical protein
MSTTSTPIMLKFAGYAEEMTLTLLVLKAYQFAIAVQWIFLPVCIAVEQ